MRFIYFIFFFFSLLLILPVKSFAVAPAPLPTGVVQVAQAVGTRVTLASLPGVSVIVPTAATAAAASLPASTVSAAAGTVAVSGLTYLSVGGVALAGGYYIGSSLATEMYSHYEKATAQPDLYPNLNAALSTPDNFVPTSPDELPQSGDIISASKIDGTPLGNYKITSSWSVSSSAPYYPINSWPGTHLGKIVVVEGRLYTPVMGQMTSETTFSGTIYTASMLADTGSPTWQPPSGGMVSPEQAAQNMTNPDGTLKPEIEAEIKAGIASGDVSPSGATIAGTTTGITPELLQLYSRLLAAQNATEVNKNTVGALQDAVNADPANVALQNQLAEAQARLAEAQAAQAAQEAALAAETAAAETATANLGPPNTYDTSLDIPVKKEIPSLLNSVFDNSPLLGMIRSFQISTANQQAVFNIGHFYGQDLVFDFTPWASVLAACGTILSVLSHAYAVFIVVKGG